MVEAGLAREVPVEQPVEPWWSGAAVRHGTHRRCATDTQGAIAQVRSAFAALA
jgi:hypothetical protein